MATRTLELQHQEDEMARFNEALHSLLSEVEVPVKSEHTVVVIMEEVVLNVIQHAGTHSNVPFIVALDVEPGRFKASVRDFGEPFDPLAREEPDTTLDIDERPIGGLGILMTKKMMSSVNYKRDANCNCLDLELVW